MSHYFKENELVTHPPHTHLFKVFTENQHEGYEGLAHTFLEASQSGKCMGLVVKVTDIKRIKKTHFFFVSYEYLFHQHVSPNVRLAGKQNLTL